jgi:hypothetical protein
MEGSQHCGRGAVNYIPRCIEFTPGLSCGMQDVLSPDAGRIKAQCSSDMPDSIAEAVGSDACRDQYMEGRAAMSQCGKRTLNVLYAHSTSMCLSNISTLQRSVSHKLATCTSSYYQTLA